MTAPKKPEPRVIPMPGMTHKPMNGKAVLLLAGVVLAVGAFLGVTVIAHVSDGAKHENGEQKVNRIDNRINERLRDLEARLDVIATKLTRIEAKLED